MQRANIMSKVHQNHFSRFYFRQPNWHCSYPFNSKYKASEEELSWLDWVVYIYLLFCIYFQQQKHCDSNYGHSITHLLPVSVTSTRCWTHNQSNHDLFINYRSSSEGRRYPVSFAVCTVLLIDFCFCTNLFPFFHTKEYDFKFGIVQMIYDKLSVKRNRGIPLFIFWDKKCLCVGQDWEHGFLQGLMTSKVIILLMSNKVCFLFFSLKSRIKIICGCAKMELDIQCYRCIRHWSLLSRYWWR